jgi:acetoin utilization deacetylase AcuC-like enzyme
MKTGYFSDPIFLQHDTGGHPENAGRLEAIRGKLEQDGLLEVFESRTSRPATREEISLVHSVPYMRQVEEAALSGRHYLNTPDCVLSEQTYTVALHAAGALVDAVTDVAEGRLDNAFLACRPPGHHAEHQQALGFCFFNNIAIGAEVLTRLGYGRVLVFDFDVHHGNGTQHTFEERKDVLFASIHQDPRTCYPGTGFSEEKGRGDGLGYTLNVPMFPQSQDDDYIHQFESVLLPAFREYNPDFILLSAGFDAHRDDPLALVDLTQEGFDAMIKGMKQLSLECCDGRLVSVLEGGYNYQRLAECVASHVSLLQEEPA